MTEEDFNLYYLPQSMEEARKMIFWLRDRLLNAKTNVAQPEAATALLGADRIPVAASGIEWVDRYSACGIPQPDPETVCTGQCEGMGVIPVQANCDDARLVKLWWELHKATEHDCDGWHFVRCPDCDGSGKRAATINSTVCT